MTTDRLQALCERGRALRGRPTAAARDWYRITNAEGERAAVYLYDVIDDWGITADAFVTELRAVSAPAIDLHINSPGGWVFDGIAIYNALRNHPATVDVTVDGLAASAASFIAQAGDTITVEKAAKLMIHEAGGLVMGFSKDMRAMADLLDELSDTIAGIYADRSGKPAAGWLDLMAAETWFGAEQAVAAGLADKVAGSETSAPDNRTRLIRARARVALGRVT